jgi:hypothetical protein
MNPALHATVYECPERRAQGPLLMSATGPQGAFVAQRSSAGAWQQLAALPAALAPAWAELQDDLAREVLFVGAVAALWPGQDPWSAPAAHAAAA